MAQDKSEPLAAAVDSVRYSIRSLNRSLRRLVPLLVAARRDSRESRKPGRRPRLSAKARASLVLQGRHMGYMRQLKPRQRAQVRKIREAKGVRTAIEAAKRFAA